MINYLKGFFLSDPYAASMTRLLAFLICVDIMGVWTYLCISTNSWVHMDADTVAILATTLGGKLAQSYIERRSANGSDKKADAV